MINILKFPYTPKTCCWVHEPGAGQSLLAVSDTASPIIRIYDGRGDGTPLYKLDKLHRAPVHLISVGRHAGIDRVCAEHSTMPSMTASYQQTSRDSSSIGSLVNRGGFPKWLGCGSTKARQTSSTLKRYVADNRIAIPLECPSTVFY